MRILVTSDLHLSDRIWTHKQILGDSYWSWKQIVDSAIDFSVDVVILAGDLLDKQSNTSEAIRQFTCGLQRLVAENIKVYYNQGQHEFQSSPWAGIVPDCVHIHKKHFAIGNTRGYGIDFQHSQQLHECLADIPKDCSVLVCHQVWSDFMGDIAKPQASFSDIPDHVKLLITGDYHKSVLTHKGHLTVISPGSSHLRSLGEPVDKCFYLLESDTPQAEPGEFEISCLLLRTRRMLDLDVEYKAELAVVEQLNTFIAESEDYADSYFLPDEIRKPIVRIHSLTSQRDLTDSIEKTFKDRVHLFWKSKSKSEEASAPADLVQASTADKLRMRDCLPDFVDATQEPAVYELSSQLVDSLSPASTLSQWVNAQIGASDDL